MKKKFFIPDEQAMLAFGAELGKISLPGTTIFLYGELGAGKTTVTRGFLRGLGYQGIVKSPTYTVVESYHINQLLIHHLDLYRLQDAEELLYIGLSDYLTKDSICLIEWPERANNSLPDATLYCKIEIPMAGEGRELFLQAKSKIGKDLLQKLYLQSEMDMA